MWTQPDYGPAYTVADYQRERAAVDAAEAYARATMAAKGPRCCSLTADEAAVPVYAAVNNEMRSRVEMWELRRDVPAAIFAYYRDCNPGHKLARGHRIDVTNWMGVRLGYATISNTWRSNFGETRAAFRLDFGGKRYAGTLYGDSGTYCRLRQIKGK